MSSQVYLDRTLTQWQGYAKHLCVVLSGVALTGCVDASGCHQHLDHTLTHDIKKTDALSKNLEVLDVIPLQSDVLVGFKSADLMGLMESPWMQGADRSLAMMADVQMLSMCRDSERVLGKSLCVPEFHQSFGLAPEHPVYIARHDGHWIWAFSSTQSWNTPPAFPNLNVTVPDKGKSTPTLVKITRKDAPVQAPEAWLFNTRGLSVVVIPGERFQGTSAQTAELAQSLGVLEPGQRWRARQEHRTLHDHFSGRAEMLIVSSTAALVPSTPPSQPALASQQRERLLSQLEYMALGIWRSPTSLGRLDGELQVMTKAGEAVFIEALKPSKAKLPKDLGALLSSQTLGAFHAAVEPRSLFKMLRDALERPQREELDQYLSYLKKDFLLDVESAFLDNLTGHMMLVIYDVQEGDSVDPSGPSIFGLDATHEVLYMPLQDRFALEQFLNAVTQLTRGRLRRQREDGVIQYVWIEDKELLGAILLGDDAVAIVDSAVSANHAMAHLTSPQPMNPEQMARFGAMFDTHQGFGLWMDPTAFSTRFTDDMSQTLKGMTHFSLTSYGEASSEGNGAMVGAKMSVTLATEAFDDPVVIGEP